MPALTVIHEAASAGNKSDGFGVGFVIEMLTRLKRWSSSGSGRTSIADTYIDKL